MNKQIKGESTQKFQRRLIKKYANHRKFSRTVQSIQKDCEDFGYSFQEQTNELLLFINKVNRLTV